MIEKNEQHALPLVGMHTKTRKLFKFLVHENEVLYPVLVFLNACNNSKSFLQSITSEEIKLIKQITSERFSSSKEEFNKNLSMDVFDICTSSLFEWSAKIDDDCEYGVELLELALFTAKLCKRNLSSKKNGFYNIIDTVISMMFTELMVINYKKNRFQDSEHYCHKQLNWLEKIKQINLSDIAKRKFRTHYILAMIYFKLGYPENMLSLLQEARQISIQHYYEEFDTHLVEFSALCREAIEFYYLKNTDLSLKIAQLFLLLPKTQAKYVLLEKNLQYFDIVFKTITKNHAKAIKALLDNNKAFSEQCTITYSENEAAIRVSPLELNLFLAYKKLLREHGVPFASEKNALKFKSVDCSIEIFEKICLQYNTVVANYQLQKSLKAQEIQPVVITSTTTPVDHPPKIYSESESTFFVSETLESPAQNKEIVICTKTKKTQKTETKTSEKVIQSSAVKFDWPNAGLTYNSLENNNGKVKKLSSTFLPEHVWFGYIPEWVTLDEHFTVEFEARLKRGLIHKDCIRDVTKELKLTDNKALSFAKSYKFKIVIPNHDYRLYGWIEDVSTDSHGKKHHLICFGCIENHKKLALPDPDTIIKRNQESGGPKLG